ncbi:MAG: peptide deformylase [Deltaproteobacteria bacterium]|jgi:peptide deformylase|nr:peptide deformylase [Deltaproteobacteria bacterium]
MILPVLQYPDPRLKRVAAPLAGITPEIRALAEDMAETMYARDGIGLAAPQVGVSLRLVVMDISGPAARENLLVLVNPQVFPLGPEMETDEGCLSVPDFRAIVSRPALVRVQALDLDGRPLLFEAGETAAVCVQHECDHLDGTLFIDRISRLKRGMYDRRLRKKDKG